jgi:NAD(P)H-flavin reductase
MATPLPTSERPAAAPPVPVAAGAGAPGPEPMLPRAFRVTATRRESYDTFTLDLVPADGGAPIAFAPGQFNMLYAPGVGEVPISISGDPGEPGVLVHTLRRVGAVTAAFGRLGRGALVGVRGPYGTSWPVARAAGRDVVLVAGGIGLAPLRPALYALLARRAEYRRVVLLYGARTPRDLLFRRELERWRARLDLAVEATVDHATEGWHGHVGVVTTLVRRAGFDPHHTAAMVCGPEVMMRFTARELERRGVAADSVFVSMERNMKCAVGLCGHCQLGPVFVCKDGPVFPLDRIGRFLDLWEV